MPLGAAPVGPPAHPGVRGRPLHVRKAGAGRAPGQDPRRRAPARRTGAGTEPSAETPRARHQAAGKVDPAGSGRAGNAAEASARRPEHAGHRKMPAQGVSGHSAARSLPVLPQDSGSGPGSLRKNSWPFRNRLIMNEKKIYRELLHPIHWLDTSQRRQFFSSSVLQIAFWRSWKFSFISLVNSIMPSNLFPHFHSEVQGPAVPRLCRGPAMERLLSLRNRA